MTDNAQTNAERDDNWVLRRFANLELVAQGITKGTPEHAEYMMRALNLPSPVLPEFYFPRVGQSNDPFVPSLERHQRKCLICHHPDREEIEELFVHWHHPYHTAHHYKIPPRSLYRHAHATGLCLARQQNLRSVLDRLLEQVHDVKVSGESIIRAVRAYSCLTSDNKWIEPPTRVIYSSPQRPSQDRRPRRKNRRPGKAALPNRHTAIRKRRPDEGRSPERVP